MAGGPAVGVRAGRHAVHRRRLHVHRRRHADPRHPEALLLPGPEPRAPGVVRPYRRHRHRRRRPGGGHHHHRCLGVARRPGGGFRLSDVAGAVGGVLLAVADPRRRHHRPRRRPGGGGVHRDHRPEPRHHRLGPLAADHPLGRLGHPFQPRPGGGHLGHDPGRKRPPAQDEIPRLPARARRIARGQENPGAGGVDHHPGVVFLCHRPRRRHRQHHLRRPQRLQLVDLRHALHLGVADSVVGAGRVHDVVSGLQDGHVHGAGAGCGGAL
nr:hypothetical protein [uncultured bacterium]